MHKKTIQEEEDEENFDSAKVNELNYELSCFYLLNGNHEDAGNLIKEILESQPSFFIR